MLRPSYNICLFSWLLFLFTHICSGFGLTISKKYKEQNTCSLAFNPAFKYKITCNITVWYSVPCFFNFREFLKKFSITVDAIPDHHPGEEIFNFLNSGKIFNQYTLDLRDSGFIGQSAVEKLILK